jgi:hypothetical protein
VADGATGWAARRHDGGPGWLEPASSVFWESVRQVRPELHRAFNPWDEITTPDALAQLLAAGGVIRAEVVPVSGRQPMAEPQDFWEMVPGSGLRATVDALGDAQRELVRTRVLHQLALSQVREVGTDVVIAVATKPVG